MTDFINLIPESSRPKRYDPYVPPSSNCNAEMKQDKLGDYVKCDDPLLGELLKKAAILDDMVERGDIFLEDIDRYYEGDEE